jgi:hypothetical protein
VRISSSAVAVGVQAFIREPRRLTVTRHRLGAGAVPLRIVQVSDLHLQAIGEFEAAERNRDPRSARAAKESGQAWVLGAHRLKTWSVAVGTPAAALAPALWRAHRQAAGLCYTGALSQRWRSRPVSGFVAARGRWTVHALAMLPGAHHLDKESAA